MQTLNTQFELIRQSATVSLTDRILALKASGRQIIGLQVGDPDFGTHPAIAEAALKAMQDGQTHYGPSNGTLELRKAIAHKLQRDEGVTYDPASEILVTNGGIHAYYTAMQSVLNPGDDVLIPDPSWATHSNMATMLRGNVIRVPAPAENGFIPHFDSWLKALTPKTRVIVLNYPSNPTGAYPNREYLQQLQDFAAKNNLWIVSDEVYGSLYYGEKPTSAAAIAGAKERTLLVQSLSKSYAMTGWRVGFLAAPAQVIANALKASQNSITCVAPFIQKAAAFALTDPAIQDVTVSMRSAYAKRRELVLRLAREFESDKVIVTPSQGAFYFFLDMRPLKMSSVEICEKLLDDVGVALVPGSAFGEQGEGFARLCIAASDADVEAGFRKIVEWAEKQ
ncbi:MAG: pyridoxal phosphate-dependent aminotransferase [Anaerolineales bacterium]|uniref:pyridoxal phosphate-dependent aminotransferase n=1 Tax=Candidatus Villigracilis vicinus TaxID=3140679 RepID=UPI0031354E29|nr:pyridoxal phosphate-dependent aminotransferase [Anaerolineales bacterium]MBK7451043.1 pyridoxal phosphate-dependent aminotransferase [Anaerolineales bacterium]MBK9778475.1 pyridoxal phosphate-dependent aminotransferase [Anaerolineales bacterium]